MTSLLIHVKRFMERRSLATRLIVLILIVAALAITILFYDLSRQNKREIETLQTKNLINDAQELAQSLDALVQSETSRIANLSLSRAVQEFINARPDQRSTLFTPTLADFSNFLATNSAYRAVLLLDNSGEVLISTEGSYVGHNFAHREFFKEAVEGRVFMSEPGISSLDQEAVIWLSAPVNKSDSDTVAGVIVVSLSPELLWDRVEQLAIGQQGYAIVLDQYGIRLAHGRDRSYVFRSLAPLPLDAWAKLQASQRFGALPQILDTGSHALWAYIRQDPLPELFIDTVETIENSNEERSRVYYSAARMDTRDWTVLAMLPESEVLAPANRVTSHGLIAAILLTLLLGVTVVWMAHRIMQPVPRLAQAAGKIARGDLSTPITIKGSSELGVLAENFERMRQNLQDSRNQLANWARSLETRVAQRSQELGALSEVVAFASLTQSRHELMDIALELSLKVMQAEMGGIWIAEPDEKLHLAAECGVGSALSEQLAVIPYGEGIIGRVQETGEPIVLEDLSRAPLLARAAVDMPKIRAVAAVPLHIHDENLGVLAVFSRTHPDFSPEVLSLATSIGQQIALTLSNMTLVDQVKEQAHRVARLQERERIGAEIHDSTAQTLGYLYLQADQLADDAVTTPPSQIKGRLLQLREVIENLSNETRQLIAGLRDISPPPPSTLEDVLRSEIDKLSKELTIELNLALQQAGNTPVSAETGAELSRIVGEALRNAQKHGRADTAWLMFDRQNGDASLVIQDNGSGFDPTVPSEDGRRHFGLSVMEARAARIGGELHIDSKPGNGTRVQVRWPVNGVDS